MNNDLTNDLTMRVVAFLTDRNHDGRLEFEEYSKLVKVVLKEDLLVRGSLDKQVRTRALSACDQMTPEELQRSFSGESESIGRFFPHGVEAPTDRQAAQLVHEVKEMANDARAGRLKLFDTETAVLQPASNSMDGEIAPSSLPRTRNANGPTKR